MPACGSGGLGGVLAALIVQALAPRVALSASSARTLAGTCLDCHGAETHAQNWLTSQHRRAATSCADCHGGDRDAPTAEAAHAAIPADQDDLQICGRCHQEIQRVFEQSPLYHRASKGQQAPTCTDCHATLGDELLREEDVGQRCAECHKTGAAAGQPNIPKRATTLLRDLHQLGLTRVLVEQRMVSHQTLGADTKEAALRVAALDRLVGDSVLEWHRFDLARVDILVQKVLAELEKLHAELDD